MDRVYMNRRTGEQRIHVEIEAAEVRDLLAVLEPHPGLLSQHEAARRFAEILRAADDALAP
ncbi:hypothetical protein ACWCXC_31735 [Streptomyces sp. NPDC001515]